MMTLQDGSQVVQTSVANVQMPLFTQQAGKSHFNNCLSINPLILFILFLSHPSPLISTQCISVQLILHIFTVVN